ncbi:MAG: DegV family EDD domain-containing protein, partial [Oscillospiraceae bacterium]|nr:DegV family EDD domain-containing protein [Oscillospiraceae bacterium]
MRIMTDTSSLLSPAMSAEEGICVVPVSVCVGEETFRDFLEISSEELIDRIAAGGVPSTSQPAVGDMLDAFEASDEETLFFTVGDGLSGAYQTAEGARMLLDNPQRVRVIDSGSLAGPLRYLARKSVRLAKLGHSIDEVVLSLQKSIDTSLSFVIPADFEFLKRSGRVTGVVAR